jgi:enterochelin esterase-like enzyme
VKSRTAGRVILLISLLAAGCSPVSEVSQASSPVPEMPESPTLIPLSNLSEPAPDVSATSPAGPSLTPDPVPGNQCLQRSGQVDEFEFESPRDGKIIQGRIFLPPCYQDQIQEDYPVVYLLHGAETDDSQWVYLGAAETAERMIKSGEIQAFIMIFPLDSGTNNPQENPFGEYLVKDLVPWIDSSYRTADERGQRAIGGVSRGGNWAVRLGILHWGIFSAVGSHSAPLFRGDLDRIPGWYETIPSEMAPDLYLDVSAGDQDLAQVQAFEEILAEVGAVYEYHLNPGLHTETYWSSHLEDYLIWYSSQISGR